MHKKAFTLVELIVVITILAILWTIAFLSFQWYTKSARDSIRINDLKLIEKNLSLYKIETWEYPLPSEPYDEVTYESKEVWTQWTVGQSVIQNLDKLNKVPRDPLTWNEYTYSRLNTKKELQLACVLEWSPVTIIKNEEIRNKNYRDFIFAFNSSYFVSQANAADVKTAATAYVIWDYNWEIAKVNSWSTTYILAVPTIINWDMTLTDIIEVISNKKLVYNWYGNLPSSYTWTIFEMNWWFDYSQTWWIVVYSWSINDLKTDEDARLELITNLQGVYSWTILENTWNIKNLLETEINLDTPTDEAKTLACWTVDFWLGTDTMKEGCYSMGDIITTNVDNRVFRNCSYWDWADTPYICDEANWSDRFEFYIWSSPWFGAIVLDKITWLYWQSDWATQWIMNWYEAKVYCSNLILWSFQDWRLPDITELHSIRNHPTSPPLDTAFFAISTWFIAERHLWSSTTYAWDADRSWYLTMSSPIWFAANKLTTDFSVRCVR